MNMLKQLMAGMMVIATMVALAANRTNVIEGVTIVIYDEPGNYTFVPDEDIASAEMLVVGGGGSGGGITGGGGGGGQVVEVASQTLTEGTAYDVTIGAGGASINSGNGKSGGTSSFINVSESVDYTALGGGAGSGGWDVYGVGTALDGANGGGRGGNGSKVEPGGAATVVGGHVGGWSGSYGGGGGGGAAEDGYDSTNKQGKAHWGGAGITNDITGAWVMYGYGGGGYSAGKSGANNGYGNGAYAASNINYPATAGENGTGGGGGGASQNIKDSGAGGSGSVIIRYTSAKKMPAEFNIESYTGWVDGESHTITVTPIWPEEYTLEYSVNGTSSFSTTKPTFSAVGSNEVFVAMTGPDCTRTVKSAVVWLVEKEGMLLNVYDTPGAHVFTATARLMADVLVVGGGGSGSSYGGGGGGGFVIYQKGIIFPAGTVCSINVGAGGAAQTAQWTGQKGGNSNFTATDIGIDFQAPGGGYGGGGWSNNNGGAGGNGGGAGGNGSVDKTKYYTGGAATVVGGHKGGDMLGTEQGKGAGGGGMAADGESVAEGGDGGAGWVIDITGTEIMYGAGGGGNSTGKGGTGDGSGDAGYSSVPGKAGNPNTGCGGGGAYNMGTSGAGGSGVVVLKYRYLDAVPPTIDDSLQGHVFEDNHLGITGKISYLGSGASSCTVKYYLGTDPAALSVVGSDVITENGASFAYNATDLVRDTVYYWKVTAESGPGSASTSDVRRNRSCGLWHYEDGIIDDGVWSFNVTDVNGKITVGAWTKYPIVASTLDFSKGITDGTATEYLFEKLNPQFSKIKTNSSAASLGDCESTLAAPYVGRLLLPETGLTYIDKAAFGNCTSLTNIVPFLPDTITDLGVSAFLAVPAVQDLSLNAVANVRHNVFHNSGVASVTFGPDLKYLCGQSGWGCFQGCANLTNIVFDSAISGAAFAGEYGQFGGCTKLKGIIDLSGFVDLYAANGAGPFSGTACGEFILGSNITRMVDRFFKGSAVTNIIFKGLPPASFGKPYLVDMPAARTIKTLAPRKLASVTNSAGKCWRDYAANGEIARKGTTWSTEFLDTNNSSATYKITDPAVRPLLFLEPDGLMIIIR